MKPRLQRDWVGLRVRSLRAIENGIGAMPADTEFLVTSVSVGKLQLRADKCACCGFRWSVRGVSFSDVEIAPTPTGTAPDKGE